MDVYTIIIAAGKGTRMKSKNSKLVQKIYDKELVKRVRDLAVEIGSKKIITVVGHMKEQVKEVLGDTVDFVEQEELLGTGHAVMQAAPLLKNKKGKVVILYGDVPIIRAETIKLLIEKSEESKEAATVLTAVYENPTGYGRIIRDEGGAIETIREEKDATEEEKQITEINAGIYCFDIEVLLEALKEIKPNNIQNEYYLTDAIEIISKKGLRTGAFTIEDNTEILGVNDRAQLELITRVLRNRINTYHMFNGVTIEDMNTTYIYDNVKIGRDTVIKPNTTIKEGAVIGEDCLIGPYVYISENSVIPDGTVIEQFEKI